VKVAISRALISVYDKTGLPELARGLAAAGVEIVSTGSTAAAIAAAGVAVTPVEILTRFPECLDGRVKTLHPSVHAGLLADAGKPEHVEQLADLGIAAFELLVSNLYPFEATVASGADPAECVEQIDIGGPAMVRAAAKNHACVAVITDPSQYAQVTGAIAEGGFTLAQRQRLAAQAFTHTARYDAAVASWFASAYAPDGTAAQTGWPDVVAALWTRRDVLRYGENPHQRAALYARDGAPSETAPSETAPSETAPSETAPSETAPSEAPPLGTVGGVAGAAQLHGKAMSYNNYVDAASALRAVSEFREPCVAIIKHSNPCGIAIGTDVAAAHAQAHACDPESAFGGVIAVNGVVTRAMAGQVADIFTEVIVAAGYEQAALDILTTKKNLRLLSIGPTRTDAGAADAAGAVAPGGGGIEWRQLDGGGMLLQTTDRLDTPGDDPKAWELRAGPAVTPEVLADLAFAWRACRYVKSNAVLLASGGATVGVGMGQVNRVDSARLAVTRAGDRAAGAVAASDAYFPFPDGLEVLTDAGVRAIVEPGGSIKDELVIEAARRAGVSLYFTGTRHFFH
jgi:phosphoribosylaminoimidazolecarboxamide formyltransferase/IMP cyclohydrolase